MALKSDYTLCEFLHKTQPTGHLSQHRRVFFLRTQKKPTRRLSHGLCEFTELPLRRPTLDLEIILTRDLDPEVAGHGLLGQEAEEFSTPRRVQRLKRGYKAQMCSVQAGRNKLHALNVVISTNQYCVQSHSTLLSFAQHLSEPHGPERAKQPNDAD